MKLIKSSTSRRPDNTDQDIKRKLAMLATIFLELDDEGRTCVIAKAFLERRRMRGDPPYGNW